MISKLMKKAVTFVLSTAMAVTAITFTMPQQKVKAAPTTSSQLVWSDEFNGSSLDTSKWGYEIGTGASGWGNNELQYYTNRTDNAYVSGGALHIRAKRESYGGKNYTSARLNTNGKFTFKYGYVEARLALPSSQGIWPAFWMLGANIGSVGWPACGEIDIMEAINAENRTYATCHWDCNGHSDYGKNTGNFDITQYHTYGLQWDSQYIRMFVDGNKIYEMYIENNAGGTEEFHRPFYLLLNVAVGGNWPGFAVNDSAFPQEMKVDYIRVWTDIHYSVNGGAQQNVRMTQSGSKATYTINGLKSGDSVKYWFTYCNTSGFVKDTESYTYNHNGSGSSGNQGNTGNQPSINPASGDVVIYQDANYGGRSASLGLGNFNLASLQAKGFKNDDLSSIKCPWGYKVTMYADDNFRGAAKVITADTAFVGSDWNDQVSSIKVEKARYRIINRHSGLCLDVSGSNTASGTNVQQ